MKTIFRSSWRILNRGLCGDVVVVVGVEALFDPAAGVLAVGGGSVAVGSRLRILGGI